MEAIEAKNEGSSITIKKSDLWKYATFVLIAVVIVVGIIAFSGKSNNGGTIDPGTNNQPPINARALIEDSDPLLGDPNAKITIIEFSDFECPFCARAFEGAIADFKRSTYFSEGQVNLIFKQFPLNQIHPYAQKAAEASLCAQDQNKFWEYHDMLFANQAALAVSDLKAYAQQLGLNTAQFNSCLDDNKYKSEVNKELAQATSSGGSGTPYFIIVNNDDGEYRTISGAYPWSQFESAINAIK